MTTLALASIVVAVAVAGVALATPKQVLAWGHHNHKHNSNSVKVDQQINQQNACISPPPTTLRKSFDTSNTTADLTGSSSSTVCLNFGDNSPDINK